MFISGIGILQIVEQINEIGIVEFKPIRDSGGRTVTPGGEGGDDALAQIGIEDFADADHGAYRSRIRTYPGEMTQNLPCK